MGPFITSPQVAPIRWMRPISLAISVAGGCRPAVDEPAEEDPLDATLVDDGKEACSAGRGGSVQEPENEKPPRYENRVRFQSIQPQANSRAAAAATSNTAQPRFIENA